MNDTILSRLSQFWIYYQNILFPFLREEDHLEPTPVLEKVIRVLEFTKIESFIPSTKGYVGRPTKDRAAIARSFVAKAVLNLPTTEMLIDRLRIDRVLRRICGFESVKHVPDASRFSRAFAEFAELGLPAKVHEALIRSQLKGHISGHNAIDSTAIEAREKPVSKAKAIESTKQETTPQITLIPDPSTIIETKDAKIVVPITTDAVDPPVPSVVLTVAATTDATIAMPKSNETTTEEPPKKKVGRPPKGEKQSEKPNLIKKQIIQSIEKAIENLPTQCDVGTKKNSKGHKVSWIGYKLHIDTIDGDIPIAAVLTSASVHDSQVAIPLIRIANERVIYFYDLADAAYCSSEIRNESRRQGNVPIIDHNPRNGNKIEFLPHEAERYKNRSQAERVNSFLKDNHGGCHVRVKGATKVFSHLMFGILVIAAEQILRLFS